MQYVIYITLTSQYKSNCSYHGSNTHATTNTRGLCTVASI